MNKPLIQPGKESEILLSAAGIEKSFRSGGKELKILQGVDFTLRRGEMSFILGRSGSGKSTFLNVLAALDTPSKGEIYFNEKKLPRSDGKLARFRNRHVGFVFQFYHLLSELNVMENVMLPARIAGMKKKQRKQRAAELIEELGLTARARHFPQQLSGGEQQRAAIARALINDPDMVLCDEPTGNLDDDTAGEVFALLLRLNQEKKKAFVIVTHDQALTRGHGKVYVLTNGKLENLENT